jgi:hypothetical protein
MTLFQSLNAYTLLLHTYTNLHGLFGNAIILSCTISAEPRTPSKPSTCDHRLLLFAIVITVGKQFHLCGPMGIR